MDGFLGWVLVFVAGAVWVLHGALQRSDARIVAIETELDLCRTHMIATNNELIELNRDIRNIRALLNSQS